MHNGTNVSEDAGHAVIGRLSSTPMGFKKVKMPSKEAHICSPLPNPRGY